MNLILEYLFAFPAWSKFLKPGLRLISAKLYPFSSGGCSIYFKEKCNCLKFCLMSNCKQMPQKFKPLFSNSVFKLQLN